MYNISINNDDLHTCLQPVYALSYQHLSCNTFSRVWDKNGRHIVETIP